MALDYNFAQKYVNLGRGLAGKFVGQPFKVYRLNLNSQGDLVQTTNQVNEDLRAKVTHTSDSKQLENEVQHTSLFQFMCSSADVNIGDILVQNDETFGQNGSYAVVSARPLKQVMCARTETYARIYRPQSNKQPAPTSKGYGAPTIDSNLPVVVKDGRLALGLVSDTASLIPVGLNTIGQIKSQKPEHLPMSLLTSWWYIYIPLLPGIENLHENDIIEVPVPDNPFESSDYPIRYRINTPYYSPVGSAGLIALCERLTI